VCSSDLGAASPVGLFGDPLAARGWDMEGLAFGAARSSRLSQPVTAPIDQVLQKSFAAPSLFGDGDNDGDVDALDLFQFRSAYLNRLTDVDYDLRFDRDIDGDVDPIDMYQFRQNFGKIADSVFDQLDDQAITNDDDPAGETPESAFDLGTLGINTAGAGFIGGDDTKDYYKFSVNEAVSFRSAITSSIGGLTLSLFDSNQQLIGSIVADEFGVFASDLESGDYFLLIESGASATAYVLQLGLI